MPLQEGYVLSGLLIAEIMASIKENSILGYTVVPYLFEWKPPSYAYTKKPKTPKAKNNNNNKNSKGPPPDLKASALESFSIKASRTKINE